MNVDFTTTNDLMNELTRHTPDGRARVLLEIIHVTGVADTAQLQLAANTTRNKVMRTLNHLSSLSLDGYPLISVIERTIKRPGESKRPSTIYRLEEGGARLLRHLGLADAQACDLKLDIPILHKLCMLSIHLEALKEKSIGIVTDRRLLYGVDKYIRPDHMVTLSDGTKYLIEIEQAANTKLLPRIIESLSNRIDFFQSSEAENFSRTVLMIINLKPGSEFQRTLRVWREAMKQVIKQRNEEKLNFSLKALPLSLFLSSPEWTCDPTERWITVENKIETESETKTQAGLRSKRSLEQDAILLRALAEDYCKKTAEDSYKLDFGMLSVVSEIYDASHGKGHRSYREISGMPMASIHLLGEYLNFHPALRTRLRQSMHYNRNHAVWTQGNILHRMRLVINTFLSYHGWRSSNLIKMYPTIDGDGRGTYTIRVEVLEDPKIPAIPSYQIESALTWVLLALFEYASDIGIGRPEFW